jgi:hypothetical protein
MLQTASHASDTGAETHVTGPLKCPLLLCDFSKIWKTSTNFNKISNVKFNENPFNNSQVISCIQTDSGRRN